MEKFNVCLFKVEEKCVDVKDCKGFIIKSLKNKDMKQESLQKEIFNSFYNLFKENDMLEEYNNDDEPEAYELNYDMIGTIHIYTYIIQLIPVIISVINICNTLGLPLEFHLYNPADQKYYNYEVDNEISEF